jgi:predicted membrane channel-forming protein YqfA (hemolysin III family)
MFPFCFIGFVTIPLVLTLKPRTSSLKEKLARVDWTGGFFFISSCTAFLIAISWGGTQEPWSSWRTLVPLLLGILGIIGTLVWEGYGAKEPFLKRSLFEGVSSYAAYFGAMVQGLLVSDFHISFAPDQRS